ncbi:DEAD/DEAH box helicase [Candidatus Nomurabacteria bacterium]|nr:DEAD/DEAH box helicase [Candidatus Nomurabacteria bacterium]
MKRFTGNYSNTEHNFVIQNLPEKRQVAESDLQLISVLKNIILRGSPTLLSKYLQSELGLTNYFKDDYFKSKVPLIAQEKQNWFSTIGGDIQNQYFPAKEFYYSIPSLLPKFSFIQNLVRPETPITEIIEEGATEFVEQRVDFYLEAAKLVIEIDGGQHARSVTLDKRRNELFLANNIATIRITTNDLRNKTTGFTTAIQEIEKRLNQFADSINFYSHKQYISKEIKSKLIPTAILRWQVLLLELLENGILKFSDKSWKLNVLNSDVKDFALPATNDLLVWIENLTQLHDKKFKKPIVELEEGEIYRKDYVNVDFSLFKRWTDENMNYQTTIFIRTDYFQSKNYFEVSGGKPITYNLQEQNHKQYLEYFLLNIFDKPNFREGQLSIICNALNRKHTIGLLPTGAGKSICYQLSSILQPGVSFIISPLKSLMFDQKENLDSAFVSNTNYISSDQSATQRAEIQKQFGQGKYLFVWISPERLQIKTFREYLSTVNSKYKIVYAVIDEVHCLSEWGHDFRTSYLNLARTIQKYCPDSKYLGLTATASSRVHKDIKAEFKIDDENIKSLISFDRKELTFIVKKCASNEKLHYTKQILQEFQNETDFLYTEGAEGKAGIIFTPHVNWDFGCYGIYKTLDKLYPKRVDFYSGEVPRLKINGVKQPIMPEKEYDDYKINVQRNFRENKFPLLTSTKAFGMGIDKPNINLTIHFGISPSIESIYQEAGRAGRHPDKQGKAKSKCYILFSDEVNEEIKDIIESPTTTFNQLFQVQQDFAFKGDDMFRQLFFYTESFVGQERELNDIINFTRDYFQANQLKVIHYSGIQDKTKKEKAIYRLSLLNVVSDYTVDYVGNNFEVSFQQKTDESVFDGLHNYIFKYEPITKDELREKVNELKDSNLTARCLRYLIYWIYDNIAYERRQALKGIADLCRDYKNSEDFKRKIIAYFEVNEVTFLLQHISEHPKDFHKWFDVFVKRNQKFEVLGYILKDKKETENLKLKLQRFLESYKNNVGLNFISGIIRLFLNEFDDQDGRTRFEQALESIKEDFDESSQDEIVSKTLELGLLIDSIGRFNLSSSFLKYFPQYSQQFYNGLGDTNSLDFILQFQTNRLQNINSILYGELTGIK